MAAVDSQSLGLRRSPAFLSHTLPSFGFLGQPLSRMPPPRHIHLPLPMGCAIGWCLRFLGHFGLPQIRIKTYKGPGMCQKPWWVWEDGGIKQIPDWEEFSGTQMCRQIDITVCDECKPRPTSALGVVALVWTVVSSAGDKGRQSRGKKYWPGKQEGGLHWRTSCRRFASLLTLTGRKGRGS